MGKCRGRLGLQATALLPMFLLVYCCSGQTRQLRSLGEIRHRFTPCSMSGRTGPSFIQCKDYYRSTSSAGTEKLLRPLISFKYDGAQYVQIPRTAVYNVSVAGAAGGRGLCSPLFGQGRVVSAQAEFYEGTRMLIMVGQKGQGPCDLGLEDTFCPYITANVSECEEAWREYLLQNNPSDLPIELGANRGGAGGGGASMIRLENEGGLQIYPFILAGAGGGGAALLDLNFVKSVNFSHSENATLNHLYREYMDGKVEEYDPVLSDHRSERGFVVEIESRTAGAGGGYSTGNDESRRVDGSAFLTEDDFGEGGRECKPISIIPITFASEVGGFGGGGGGCAGGGGGGGHTGGAIVGISNTVPGGGGHSFVVRGAGAPSNVQYSLNNESSGYVEIVPAECGCVYECIVYEEEDQFECLCPNDTQLAPDFNDCYYTEKRDVNMTMFEPLEINRFKLTPITFGNSSFIFSANVGLHNTGSRVKRLSTSEDEDDRCVLIFIGGNDNIVLVTNPVRGSEREDSLSRVSFDGTSGALQLTNYTALLRSSILVTGAVIAGTGDCAVGSTIALNISTRKNDIKINITAVINLLNGSEIAVRLLSQILQLPGPSSTTTIEPSRFPSPDDEATTAELSSDTIALIVVLILLTTLLVLIALTGVGIFIRRRRKRALGMTLNKDLPKPLRETEELSSTPYVSYAMTNHNTEKNDGYEVLEFDYGPNETDLTRESGTNSHLEKFQLKYGVSAPIYDFTDFNRRRAGTVINDWNYPRSHLIFLRDLGEGQFGKVMLMKTEDIGGFKGKIPVAVKTLSSQDPNLMQKFMEEAELMKRFTHPNIVSLLGICNPDVDSAPLMILEYMPYGDLEGFLQNHRPTEEHPISLITEGHFYDFAMDVANALDFLSTHKYVHRDIAARNCLVGTKLQIKIADFGLARGVYDKDYYRIAGRAVLPVRWMAPECLIYGIFNVASDVWAYGTLLWEITSYGVMPLQEYEVPEIVEMAQQGTLRHLQPLYCPDNLYVLMCKCHMCDCSERPSFAAILDHLTSVTEIQKTDTENSVQT